MWLYPMANAPPSENKQERILNYGKRKINRKYGIKQKT